ncbi:MAG: PilZ domain-containing protein [Cyanobium sp.]
MGEDTAGAHLQQARDNWCRDWEERRSHQRNPLGTGNACNLALDSAHYPPMPVELQDISLGGACLLISSLVELRRGEMGELRRQGPPGQDDDPLDRRRLRICWQEIREWITAVGVAFEPPLPALPDLAAGDSGQT